MSKRDRIQEIIDRRARAADSDRLRSITPRLVTISTVASRALVNVDSIDHKQELLRYVPIGLVACLETYFRNVIKDLIDFSEECRRNASALREIKFELESVLAIHGRTVTVGEFVAHHLPIRNFVDINSHLTKVLGTDFKETLKREKPIADNIEWNEIIATITETFEKRHVFCHEAAIQPELTEAHARTMILRTWFFIIATENVVIRQIGLRKKHQGGLMSRARTLADAKRS